MLLVLAVMPNPQALPHNIKTGDVALKLRYKFSVRASYLRLILQTINDNDVVESSSFLCSISLKTHKRAVSFKSTQNQSAYVTTPDVFGGGSQFFFSRKNTRIKFEWNGSNTILDTLTMLTVNWQYIELFVKILEKVWIWHDVI